MYKPEKLLLKSLSLQEKRKIEYQFIEDDSLYEFHFEIDVKSYDPVYSSKGTILLVEYSQDKEEITRYGFFEKETNRHIKYAMNDAEEELVLTKIKEDLS